MHASTIETHEALTHVATDLVSAWRGTPPMTSEAQVREALTIATEGTMANAESVDVLLPYVVDACRKEGLLITEAVETANRSPILVIEPGGPGLLVATTVAPGGEEVTDHVPGARSAGDVQPGQR